MESLFAPFQRKVLSCSGQLMKFCFERNSKCLLARSIPADTNKNIDQLTIGVVTTQYWWAQIVGFIFLNLQRWSSWVKWCLQYPKWQVWQLKSNEYDKPNSYSSYPVKPGVRMVDLVGTLLQQFGPLLCQLVWGFGTFMVDFLKEKQDLFS